MKKLEEIFQNGPISVHGEGEMLALGERLAGTLSGGEVIGLVGELGAGKTHLVQGVLRGLGAGQAGASPTFSLVHEHRDGRLPVAHFDFYRMRSPQEATGLGWEEYLAEGAVLLVEWADRFDGVLMPSDTLWLVLEHSGEETRRVSLAGL